MLGLSRHDVESLSPGQIAQAYAERIAYDEQLERRAWERTRFQAYAALVPYDSRRRLRQPSDLMDFPWEKPEAAQAPLPETEEEAQARRERFARWDAEEKARAEARRKAQQ